MTMKENFLPNKVKTSSHIFMFPSGTIIIGCFIQIPDTCSYPYNRQFHGIIPSLNISRFRGISVAWEVVPPKLH